MILAVCRCQTLLKEKQRDAQVEVTISIQSKAPLASAFIFQNGAVHSVLLKGVRLTAKRPKTSFCLRAQRGRSLQPWAAFAATCPACGSGAARLQRGWVPAPWPALLSLQLVGPGGAEIASAGLG